MTLAGARTAIERATRAIATLAIDDASPFASSEALAKRALGHPDPDADLARLRFWDRRVPGTRVGDDRYRWEISHRRCKGGAHVPPRAEWSLLRPDERDVETAELRISLPLSIADGCEYLTTLASGEGETAALATRFLAEAEPLFRRDLAGHVQAQNPWADTFALRAIAARPHALERLRPLAIAIAASYAPLVDVAGAAAGSAAGGTARTGAVVRGLRYPLHERPLVSASAQLAAGLCALGHDLPLLGELLATVRAAQHESGAFGDELPDRFAEKLGRDDLLTTFAAADVLGALDPSFDLDRALAWVIGRQRPDGFFVAFGPELGWLTGEVIRLLEGAERPFAERFRFPSVPAPNRDRKTGLPFCAFFDDLSHLFAELAGLADATVPVAFLDLAGFGAFNNAFGQDLGDDVLAAIARELDQIPFARAIRDGGDEFLVVGAPGRTGLDRDLDALRAAWPARFHAAFGDDVPPVAPRILVTEKPGRALRESREHLGRSMGSVKEKAKTPPPEGILARI